MKEQADRANDFIDFIAKSPQKLLTIISIPFGLALYSYIMLKTKEIKRV